ncbi:Pentatricopeptide repeat-containing protein, mitochondrial [Vitis vinifera]|uniref:Pentatricopeptide repeat-containing protein, mitochondrial n=1 Tax=Vitis vinifera TaxID=29760 RepID=A0A438JF65_VITVI|nr:Pentatricopeptide repeat-containing protein, mitochondrial [Vitis vinifera]
MVLSVMVRKRDKSVGILLGGGRAIITLRAADRDRGGGTWAMTGCCDNVQSGYEAKVVQMSYVYKRRLNFLELSHIPRNPNLSPKVRLLCEIIANTPSSTVEEVLHDTAIRVSPEDVEDSLKLSYGFPGSAVKFFRWSGHQLNDNHSPYSWNLVVDMLGKNFLFDAMWDAVKSMKKQVRLSSDIVALNSLLSAICRDGRTVQAAEFLRNVRGLIRPDADTYAILLEGWESEGNCGAARQTFDEMVMDIGWDPGNVSAYDSFLNALLHGPDGRREAMKFFEIMRDRQCSPGMKFYRIGLQEPDTEMYNSMIALHCSCDNIVMARGMLDEMVCNGAFPDSETYNVLFRFLIRRRKLEEAFSIFSEMVQNECVPDLTNCNAAVSIYLDLGDVYKAIKVWKYIIENHDSGLEETGNLLVTGLRDHDRIPEAVKYAKDMIVRGIKLTSSTLSKLKHALVEVGKGPVYDELLRKWKTR